MRKYKMRKRDVIMYGYVGYVHYIKRIHLYNQHKQKNCLPDNQADIQHRHWSPTALADQQKSLKLEYENIVLSVLHIFKKPRSAHTNFLCWETIQRKKLTSFKRPKWPKRLHKRLHLKMLAWIYEQIRKCMMKYYVLKSLIS